MIQNHLALWAAMCIKVIGVNHRGDEITRHTELGLIAASQGVPVYYEDFSKDGRRKIANFLHAFADGIEGNTEQPINLNTRLLTKDGRQWGNAIVQGPSLDDDPPDTWRCMTDYGHPLILTEEQIRQYFYVDIVADATHKHFVKEAL